MSGKGTSGESGKARRHPGVRGKRPDKYARRVEDAQDRAEARAHLTAAEQLARLDRRLGVGVGAVKERARLAGEMREAG